MLGILAQMPGMRMHIRIMSKLVYEYLPNNKPNYAVGVLAQRGLVDYDRETGWVTLTEAGATRQRQLGRPEVIRFVRVPRIYFGE